MRGVAVIRGRRESESRTCRFQNGQGHSDVSSHDLAHHSLHGNIRWGSGEKVIALPVQAPCFMFWFKGNRYVYSHTGIQRPNSHAS